MEIPDERLFYGFIFNGINFLNDGWDKLFGILLDLLIVLFQFCDFSLLEEIQEYSNGVF
jgi:hypothetical protein